MVCQSITFKDFRNVEDEVCDFCDGVNLLWGKNAQGKSNMLEGVYFFARGKSFRGAKEKELIRFGGEAARLSLDFRRDEDKFPVKLEALIPTAGRKLLSRNGGKLSGVRDMIGDFRAVLFSPTHLTLVSGGPAVRRNFMDIALSQLYPAYLESLSAYKRLLLQRNALIKDVQMKKILPSEEIWEAYALQMSALSAGIAQRRYEYMKELNCSVKELFSGMTGGREEPELIFHSEALPADPDNIMTEGKDSVYRSLTENTEREIKYGATLFGIHKDDIAIKLNGKEAKLFASQGQQRSLALSMKLAEGEMSKKLGGEYPVFLLDDVLSELDSERREFVLSKLRGRQIIVTSCEPDLFSGGGADRLIHIENGKIIGTE